MTRKPADRGEVFERGPDGRPTDARLWDAMLDGDTKGVLDGRDPEAIKRRLAEHGTPAE